MMRAGEIVVPPESKRSLETPRWGAETEGATAGRVGPWDDLKRVLRAPNDLHFSNRSRFASWCPTDPSTTSIDVSVRIGGSG